MEVVLSRPMDVREMLMVRSNVAVGVRLTKYNVLKAHIRPQSQMVHILHVFLSRCRLVDRGHWRRLRRVWGELCTVLWPGMAVPTCRLRRDAR